jgi:hypothetical protein
MFSFFLIFSWCLRSKLCKNVKASSKNTISKRLSILVIKRDKDTKSFILMKLLTKPFSLFFCRLQIIAYLCLEILTITQMTKKQQELKGSANEALQKAEVVKFNAVEERIITLRGERALLDNDVADLYGVQTKRINEAVANNPDRFPEGYVFELQSAEKQDVVEIFDRFDRIKHSTVLPKAFTEKGLYMLATILKSPRAIQTSIAIVEAFTKIRELARTVAELSAAPEEFKQKSLIQKGGNIISDILGDDLQISAAETKYEINFALLKITHTVKKTSKT